MRLKTIVAVVGTTMLCACSEQQTADKQRAAFVDSLMKEMTLEEKIGQLNLIDAGAINTGEGEKGIQHADIRAGRVGAVLSVMGQDEIRQVQHIAAEESRLGIPLLFGLDVIHGYRTIFPIPLALSCTWDTAAVRTMARIAAAEGSADGINWFYSPMVDIARDARWGRVAESSGEDPFLGSAIAQAYIKGYQNGSENENVLACVKHFAMYGASESGLDYNITDMSRVRMYNEYLPPYKAAVEAGAASIMSSFNTIDYVPATCSKWLLNDLLRDEWKFDGFVSTDYGSIGEATVWGVGDLQETSAKALQAGTDMDMCSKGFVGTLKKSVEEGRVSERDIDVACRRVLLAKYDLGLFGDPYKFCDTERVKTAFLKPEYRAVARQIAAESFVLLKNDNNTLPLQKAGKIALVGPLAHADNNMIGCWAPTADAKNIHTPTLYEGMQRALEGKATITYAKGSNIYPDQKRNLNVTWGDSSQWDPRPAQTMIDEAVRAARGADVVIAAIGEAQEMTGESASRASIELPDSQKRLLEALHATGKPVVVVYFTGRPVVMRWEKEHIPAILNVWFGGTEGANAICDVLFGDVCPVGKLTTSFPYSTGQEPFYYGRSDTGRPLGDRQWFAKFATNYLDEPSDAIFPFGYGLSYTTFEYSDMKVEKVSDGDVIARATATVKNTGNRDGIEIVQMYTADPSASIVRPAKELKGFRRVELKAGESQTVVFDITRQMLSFYNADLKFAFEPGEFKVMIGSNSRDVMTERIELE